MTITYDLRGIGQSDRPSDPTTYTTEVLADDAKAILDGLEVRYAHISGLSLGAAVAMQLAIRYPEKVATLQLHAPWARSDEWFRRVVETMRYPAERGDFAFASSVDQMWSFSRHFLAERLEEARRMQRLNLVENPYPPTKEGLLGHYNADMTHDAYDRLPEIKAPTLITSGELDWYVPVHYAREVHERIPNSELHVFSGPSSSHAGFFENADTFNTVTMEFLRRHRGHKPAISE